MERYAKKKHKKNYSTNMAEITIKQNLSINLNKNKWHMPFATIYCSRAFLSLSPPSRIPNFSGFSPSTLNHLLKDKTLHQLSLLKGPHGIAAALKTDSQLGIIADQHDLAARRQAFGTNTYPSPPFLHFTLTPFKDPAILLLLACAAISLVIGIKDPRCKQGLYDGSTIFFLVFLIISISAVTSFRQFHKPSKLSTKVLVQVVRSRTRQDVPIHDVVVGDIVFLNTGVQVPADGLFVEGHSLRVESEIESSANNPFLFSGTKVAQGYGKMLVTGVGMNTLLGEKMSMMARFTDQATPLQSRLNKLTFFMLKLGLAADFLVLVVWVIRYFTGYTQDDNGEKEFNWSRTKVVDVINSAIGIIAAVIIAQVAAPERSPLALTLTFANFMKRMMADQSMVRKLSACETMGSATTICTDKTGTLTMNNMMVTKFWLGKECFEGGLNMGRRVLELLREGAGLNTTGGVYMSQEGLEFSGSPTEKAILSWAVADLGMDMEHVKSGCEILHVEAFTSENKRSGVLMKRDHEFHVHWKGAAEMILAMCSHYYDLEGEKKDLNDEERMQFSHIIQGMAATSLRCVAFAHRLADDVKLETESKIQEDGLVLLGLVGLKDPCRPGVKKAQRWRRRALI